MTELDRDIQAVEHRLWMAHKGVNQWEIPSLEARLVTLKAERVEMQKLIQSTVKPYRPLPPRFEILAKWEPDFAFTPQLIDESFYECQERANRQRGL